MTSPFDAVAEIYDRVRPGYPPEFFDQMFEAMGERPGGERLNILEVGAGTGKATGELLRRGARVTAIELGPRLAGFLREKFKGQALEVVNGAFESLSVEGANLDAVVAALAWDWLDPATRVERAATALRPRGVIAILAYTQVQSERDRGFFERCFPVYRKYRPDEPETRGPDEDFTPGVVTEIEASGRFELAAVWRQRWDQRYSTPQYADLLRSYSTTEAMPPGPREGLIADLCALIDEEFEGYVVRPLVATLVMARRRH